ncbi:MAG: NUDIX hydrolase [Dehalococcoidia bacterium]
MFHGALVAADGREYVGEARGQTWSQRWFPPREEPHGTRHGSAGIGLSGEGVVVISEDTETWDFPAGRPEGDETWEETLRREVREEACAEVVRARLLGFARGECLRGHEKGLVLVRSWWRADVELSPWEPRFEVTHREVLPSDDALRRLTVHEGLLPCYRRALAEAGLDHSKIGEHHRWPALSAVVMPGASQKQFSAARKPLKRDPQAVRRRN